MLRYLVSFRNIKKLVVVESKANFEEKCRAVFDIQKESSIKLDFFFEEFNEYVELSDIRNELPDTGKIRITIVDTPVVIPEKPSCIR